MSDTEHDLLTEVKSALRFAGHDAEWVQGSPVHLVNVWIDRQGRAPHATVGIDDGVFVWGHAYEHMERLDEKPANVAKKIISTSRKDADV